MMIHDHNAREKDLRYYSPRTISNVLSYFSPLTIFQIKDYLQLVMWLFTGIKRGETTSYLRTYTNQCSIRGFFRN